MDGCAFCFRIRRATKLRRHDLAIRSTARLGQAHRRPILRANRRLYASGSTSPANVLDSVRFGSHGRRNPTHRQDELGGSL